MRVFTVHAAAPPAGPPPPVGSAGAAWPAAAPVAAAGSAALANSWPAAGPVPASRPWPAAGAVPATGAAPLPAPGDDPVPEPRLVREGFAWWAFLLGPLWLLFKGLWLPLLAFLLLSAAIAFALPPALLPPAGLALGLLLGFHGRDLERWRLARRGLPERGVVLARNEEEAMLRLGSLDAAAMGKGWA
ncbi:DUF2628 domain-containing protein [Roseomonas sp. BN140053]|uniref:DUF2628 domain-containing protein n=1 Tax=Roseomonas sp. BN140053 TaxID=3391898 RepID=UPI0039EC307B